MDYYFINYGLILITIFITLLAQGFISFCYNRTSKKENEKDINGAETARQILDNNGLSNIKVVETDGHLTDHYDPKNKVIRLSDKVYNDSSIASVSIAAHECGHAIQDKNNYLFLRIRHSLVPLVNFSSYAGYLAITIGLIFSFLNLIWIGIILEAVILAFQLITLPVEFNASRRGLKQIRELGLLNTTEQKSARTMLISAALTYVASAANALIQILRLILIFGGRRDD